MTRLEILSFRAQRPPAGGQEESFTLNGQTPPTVGMTRLGILSFRAQRPPAGGQEESFTSNVQTPPTVGVTRLGILSTIAQRRAAGGQEGSLIFDEQRSVLCHYNEKSPQSGLISNIESEQIIRQT